MAMKEVGKNCKITADKKGKVTVEFDATKEFGRSKSGKTITISSTEGNLRFELEDGSEIVLGFNAYKYPPEEK